MRHMGDWRDKEDLELTSEDIGAMMDAGEPVLPGRPKLPDRAILVSAVPTYGQRPVTAVPLPWTPTRQVSQPLTAAYAGR